MNLFVAGKMRGLPQFGFPAFDQATEVLREHGHDVFSPAERDRLNGFNPEIDTLENFDLPAAHRDNLNALINWADGIVLLPGWRGSQGAKMECLVAVNTGKILFQYHPDAPLPLECIEEPRITALFFSEPKTDAPRSEYA